MKNTAINILKYVMKKIDNIFFPILLGFLAAIDHFVIIIPSDGILVTSVFIRKKKWLRNAIGISLGSTLGAMLLVLLIHDIGLNVLIQKFPSITSSQFWPISHDLLEKYGLWGLFIMMVSPLMQQPMLCLIGLSDHPFSEIAVVVLIGKAIKYFAMSWVASKFPEFIRKSKLLGQEVQEVLDNMEETANKEEALVRLHKNEKPGEKAVLP